MIEVQFKLAIFTSAAREPEEGPPMFPRHVIEVQFKLEIFTSAARPVVGWTPPMFSVAKRSSTVILLRNTATSFASTVSIML